MKISRRLPQKHKPQILQSEPQLIIKAIHFMYITFSWVLKNRSIFYSYYKSQNFWELLIEQEPSPSCRLIGLLFLLLLFLYLNLGLFFNLGCSFPEFFLFRSWKSCQMHLTTSIQSIFLLYIPGILWFYETSHPHLQLWMQKSFEHKTFIIILCWMPNIQCPYVVQLLIFQAYVYIYYLHIFFHSNSNCDFEVDDWFSNIGTLTILNVICSSILTMIVTAPNNDTFTMI